jgi:hypothetical protein
MHWLEPLTQAGFYLAALLHTILRNIILSFQKEKNGRVQRNFKGIGEVIQETL